MTDKSIGAQASLQKSQQDFTAAQTIVQFDQRLKELGYTNELNKANVPQTFSANVMATTLNQVNALMADPDLSAVEPKNADGTPVMMKDPATGQMVPTPSPKQAAINNVITYANKTMAWADTFYAGSPAPKALFGYTNGLSRDILEDLKRDYYDEVDVIQDTISFMYDQGFRLHLLLKGINPDDEDFTITFAERRTETPNQVADRALKLRALVAVHLALGRVPRLLGLGQGPGVRVVVGNGPGLAVPGPHKTAAPVEQIRAVGRMRVLGGAATADLAAVVQALDFHAMRCREGNEAVAHAGTACGRLR